MFYQILLIASRSKRLKVEHERQGVLSPRVKQSSPPCSKSDNFVQSSGILLGQMKMEEKIDEMSVAKAERESSMLDGDDD